MKTGKEYFSVDIRDRQPYKVATPIEFEAELDVSLFTLIVRNIPRARKSSGRSITCSVQDVIGEVRIWRLIINA